MDERFLELLQPGEEVGLDRLHNAKTVRRRRHNRSRPAGLTLEETVTIEEEVFGSLNFSRLDHESERSTIIRIRTVVKDTDKIAIIHSLLVLTPSRLVFHVVEERVIQRDGVCLQNGSQVLEVSRAGYSKTPQALGVNLLPPRQLSGHCTHFVRRRTLGPLIFLDVKAC